MARPRRERHGAEWGLPRGGGARAAGVHGSVGRGLERRPDTGDGGICRGSGEDHGDADGVVLVTGGTRWRAENRYGARNGDELRQAGGAVDVAGLRLLAARGSAPWR